VQTNHQKLSFGKCFGVCTVCVAGGGILVAPQQDGGLTPAQKLAMAAKKFSTFDLR
jgi:hypothetical protein